MPSREPEPEPEPEPAEGGVRASSAADGEELYTSRHPETAALEWLEHFLPGGSQIATAKGEMERKGLTSRSLHYAEISLNFFALLLERAQAQLFPELACRGTFVDIGSGLGKAVVAASLTSLPWSRCVGIEVMEDMVAQSEILLQRWAEEGGSLRSGGAGGGRERGECALSMTCADATALEGELRERVAEAEVRAQQHLA